MDLASIVTNASIFLNPTDNCFTVYENQWSSGGTMVGTVGSLQGCREACLEDVECASFDFNRNDTSCWKYTVATMNHVYTTSFPVDYYVRKDCSSVTGNIPPEMSDPFDEINIVITFI